MAHSKLPWKRKHHRILDFHGRLIADVRGACGFGEDNDNANFIFTACNEHDTLKAKAELFDEIEPLLETAIAFSLYAEEAECDKNCKTNGCWIYKGKAKLTELLSKAKELKC